MREDLRIYYKTVRNIYGGYCLLLAAVSFGLLPLMIMAEESFVLNAAVAAFLLILSIMFLVSPLAPNWMVRPRSIKAGLATMTVLGIGLACVAILNQSMVLSIGLTGADAFKVFLLFTLPGFALAVVAWVIVAALTVTNRKAMHYYYLRPGYTAEEPALPQCWTETNPTAQEAAKRIELREVEKTAA